MKYLHILILVLFSRTTNSQSYEYIKKLDTIYIPFREGKFNIIINYPEEKKGFKNREYIFNHKKKNENTLYFEIDRKRLTENKKLNKSFLRKNKSKIIEIDSLKNFDHQDIACNIFNRLKIIYIIDLSQKKTMLYRVISMNYCIIGE